MRKPKKPSGVGRAPRPSQTCTTCGETIYAANQHDLAAAVAKHQARHAAKQRGGA